MSPARRKKKSAAKKSAPNKSAAKKSAPKKSPAKKSAKKSSVKKAPPSRPGPRKAAAKQPAPAEVAGRKRDVRRERPPTPVEPPTADDAIAARAAAKAERRGRARRRQAHIAERMGSTDVVALAEAMNAVLARTERRIADAPPAEPPARRPVGRARPGPALAFATVDVNRWVPIGPSVVRRGQADGRPRVTGRVRDLAVDVGGRRAYAASGKAGVWYTEDAGSSWQPVGGWVTTPGRVGGASTDLSCGCLLVQFGATAADDYVMVGTGELGADDITAVRTSTHLDFGGRGVLAGRGPQGAAVTASPFEAETGIAVFENFAIFGLARDPGITAPNVGAAGDRVVAASGDGLFLGVRANVGGTLTWQWSRIAGVDTFRPNGEAVVDVQWVPVAGNADGRIVVAISRQGVAWSDNLGNVGSWNWVGQLNRPSDNIRISGAHKLSGLVGGDRIYVLHGRERTSAINGRNDDAFLNRIPNITRTVAAGGPGASERVRGVPDALWGAQRFWNQTIFAERVGTTDRVWVGGSGVTPYTGADFSAALYCYDVTETGANAPRLVPAVGVSRTAAPPTGEGANVAALVGNGIHADVHACTVVTLADGSRHVWVGCDGGVYVSERGGRVNTFQSRVTGLAVIEAGFVAVHPTSSQYCALGAQDNGVQARTGDTVWEMVQMGDGGGVMFHPTASQYLISQYTNGTWNSTPSAGFVDPIGRGVGGSANNDGDRESDAAMFYSGCDAIASATPNRGRIAIGTNRVWVSDNLGATAAGANNTWRVIRFDTTQALAANDPRPGGADSHQQRGVPTPALGPVVQVRWESPTRLYVVYREGIVRHDEGPPGTWTTTLVLQPGQAGAPNTGALRITDLAPIPGTTDFYVTTLGDRQTTTATQTDTCWLFIGGAFVRTNLRRQLDTAGPPPTLGPNDPAHAVCLDPDDDTIVFVGTMGGVWRGERAADNSHDWNPFMEGLPVTCVSDLKIWREPGAAPVAVKLLRAATQSRGVWEVNLAASEPRRTYLRVHANDDRRRLPSPLANPRVATTAAAAYAYASPDIVIRPAPRAAAAAAVPFPLTAAQSIGPSHSGSYHLWTFQTAFRWHFPAVRADGVWSDQLADLVRLHRSSTAGLGTGDRINKATWDNVVGGTRLDAARAVSAAAADRWAVYETPWQTGGTAANVATEVDVMELVQPLDVRNGIWRVYAEPCTVDILVHHRDTRPLVANDPYTALFWRSAPSDATLLAELAETFASLHTWAGAPAVPTPTGWNRVSVSGSAVHRLPLALDAFMPRAISVDVDLSAVTPGDHVLFVAVCGGSTESPPLAPTGLQAGVSTIVDLVRAWPRAAMRLVQVAGARPV